MARCIGFLAASALWLATTGIASAQATVEYGLGAARAATTTAPAAGIGKALSGLAGKLDGTTKAPQPDSAARPSATPPGTPGTAAPPAKKWEDPSAIETGLAYDELLRRFGPPSLEITGETGKMLTYSSRDGAFHIGVEDGQVTSIRKPVPRTTADARKN